MLAIIQLIMKQIILIWNTKNLLRNFKISQKQALKYQGMGAKTFRVAMKGDMVFNSETECLSETKVIQCDACGLCNGKKRNIVITVHGSRASKFKSKLIAVG